MSTRDRFRAQVRDEIKETALTQLADGGPQALSLNAIAKQLGVTGPALYRYFAGRDALLTELIVDAYDDLAAALASAVDGAPDPLRALGRAYRQWAVAQPHRYRLLFGPPLPNYDAHAERLVEAAQRSMTILLDVARDMPAESRPSRALARQLNQWAKQRDVDADPATALRALTVWARLHGVVSLEISGNFASMGVDPEQMLESELSALES